MNRLNNQINVAITPMTILTTFGIIIGIGALWYLRDILILLFIAFIFMSGLRPAVDALEQRKVPRVVAAVLSVLILIIFITALLVYVIPPIAIEMKQLGFFIYKQTMVFLQQQLQLPLTPAKQIESLLQFVPNLTINITQLAFWLLGNLFNLLAIFFFTIYMLLAIPRLHDWVHNFLSERKALLAMSIADNIEQKLGQWMRGELVLMFSIGFATYIGLMLLGIPYALPLAVIAGLLEIVPTVGPILSSIPAILIASTISPLLALVVMVLYIIIQQVENYLLVPTIMKRAVGIAPLAALLALMVGGKIAGVSGALLAIPFVVSITIVVQEILHYYSLTHTGTTSTESRTSRPNPKY